MRFDPVRWMARWLRRAPRSGLRDTLVGQERAGDRALMVVRLFYAVSLLWVVISAGGWRSLRAVETVEPRWPAGWVDGADPGAGIDAILILYAVAAFAVALLPSSLFARAAYAVGLLQYMAIEFGFGKIDHHMHAWFWVSVVFVFLPSGRSWRERSTEVRHRILAVVWAAQVLVLYFYTLTGLWKVLALVLDLLGDRVNALEPDGFALIVADRIAATDQVALLGSFFVEHRWLGWAMFNGTMYLEVASLVVAFRPRLHRLWGAGLITFHVGTLLAMGFTFRPNIVLLAILFLCSPWAPDSARWHEVIRDLPGFGFVLRRITPQR